ncbi:MAG: hypothetical protein ACYC20_10445 [Sulfurovum sp.]
MRVKWKRQRLNNGCFVACLAMLLEAEGIEKEDCDIVREMSLPYILRHLPGEGRICAGASLADEDPAITAGYLSPFGLRLRNAEHGSFGAYLAALREIRAAGKAAITSLPYSFIPSPLYCRGGGAVIPGSHAIVLHSLSAGSVSFYDPSGGLDRGREISWEEAKPFVDHVLSLPGLKAALGARGKYLLGCLERSSGGGDAPARGSWLRVSLAALDGFSRECSGLAEAAASRGGNIPVPEFMTSVMGYFKPVALDWRGALETLPGGAGGGGIIARLAVFQAFLLHEQRRLKETGSLSPEFPEELRAAAKEIVARASSFLSAAFLLSQSRGDK